MLAIYSTAKSAIWSRSLGNASLPAFRTDIRDQGDKFLLEAELPGFNKEDISLDLKEGILTIKAEHKDSQDQKNDKGEYIRRERRYGSFARTFDVSGINESGITAAYNNGIPEGLKAATEKNKVLAALIVPLEDLPEAMRQLRQKSGRIHTLYKAVQGRT